MASGGRGGAWKMALWLALGTGWHSLVSQGWRHGQTNLMREKAGIIRKAPEDVGGPGS